MPKVTYIAFDGTEHGVDLPVGWSLMEGAISNAVDGIEGECGGACACATCHCYVEESWLDRLDPMTEMEDGMLDCTASPREANSRLGCQVRITADMDGLVVRLPEAQG